MNDSDMPVICEVRGQVAGLVLNRPEALNSFNPGMIDAMLAGLREIRGRDDVRVVRLSARGRGFCAGQDLKQRFVDLQQGAVDLGQALDRGFNRLVQFLRSFRQPVVCAVNGYASGAGVGLALACDLVVAARSARFDLAFSRLGLVPDAGTSLLLSERIGAARARGLCLLGESVSAAVAEDWGLVWRCVEDEDLDLETDRLIARLLERPVTGQALTRQLLNRPFEPLADRLRHEAEAQREAGRHPDYREAVEAFVAKRPPRFQS